MLSLVFQIRMSESSQLMQIRIHKGHADQRSTAQEAVRLKLLTLTTSPVKVRRAAGGPVIHLSIPTLSPMKHQVRRCPREVAQSNTLSFALANSQKITPGNLT